MLITRQVLLQLVNVVRDSTCMARAVVSIGMYQMETKSVEAFMPPKHRGTIAPMLMHTL